eukprot:scaffold9252_cov160-Skeletonema_marinoi.AAC.1
MVSRKAAKAEEEAQRQAPEAQMQQFVRSASAQIAGRDTTTTCWHHGMDLPSLQGSCSKLVISFRKEFDYAARDGVKGVPECLAMAKSATIDKFANVWKDTAEMKIAISVFLSAGVQDILKGRYSGARVSAAIIRYLADYIAVHLKQTQALVNYPKIHEVHVGGDIHTLVKFYRRRIHCSCLDEKYKEVKSAPKMGYCYNSPCKFLCGQVERSKTFYCSRCRCVTYCSRGCQKAHWRTHQIACDECAAIKDEFVATKKT